MDGHTKACGPKAFPLIGTNTRVSHSQPSFWVLHKRDDRRGGRHGGRHGCREHRHSPFDKRFRIRGIAQMAACATSNGTTLAIFPRPELGRALVRFMDAKC
jgi:hypothetical protein